MTRPLFVTFTGLDERTDVVRAAALAERYPIEWGVLLSRARAGSEPRRPALALFPRFVGLRLSAHVCGSWAREVADGGRFDAELGRVLAGTVRRIQLNIAYGETDVALAWVGGEVRALGANRAIIQCRGEEFPAASFVDWLFDRSGGRGEAPGAWPRTRLRAFGRIQGYAGGITPSNVLSVLRRIAETKPDGRPHWIDMESGVRTGGWLDLDKCEAVCRAVYES